MSKEMRGAQFELSVLTKPSSCQNELVQSPLLVKHQRDCYCLISYKIKHGRRYQ